ncbi:hypothetical protein ACQJBY_001241 [Aegilops geniculata]|nr:uncharacterized protein LOC109755165 isoform X1 [Aegilops tauschii subsp. strangulata]
MQMYGRLESNTVLFPSEQAIIWVLTFTVSEYPLPLIWAGKEQLPFVVSTQSSTETTKGCLTLLKIDYFDDDSGDAGLVAACLLVKTMGIPWCKR